jgi:hypothetical protein
MPGLFVFARMTIAIAEGFEHGGPLLLVQPAEKFLKPCVCQNDFNGIKRVAKLVMTPRFVDEILARVARGNDFGAALAAWNDVVPARGYLALTEHARVGHSFD